MRALLWGCLLWAAGCATKLSAESDAHRSDSVDTSYSSDRVDAFAQADSDSASDASSSSDAVPIMDAKPEVDAAPLDPCRFRILGYGQTVPMKNATEKTVNRKSGIMCLTKTSKYNLKTRGQGTGACDGDSGGPLYIDGTQKLVGILHGSTNDCHPDEEYALFGSIEGHRSFIEDTLSANPE